VGRGGLTVAGEWGWPSAPQKGSGICDLKVATGLNLFSKGTDPPLSPTEDYPEWLWKLKEPMLNLSELREARTADPFGMSLKEGRRLVKYEARQKIKGNNNRRSKG
jgi:hypothetical protein